MTLEKAAELTSTVVRVVEQGAQGALDGRSARRRPPATPRAIEPARRLPNCSVSASSTRSSSIQP